MKKIFVLICASILSFASISAQEYKHEISVAYCGDTSPQISNMYGSLVTSAYLGGNYTIKNVGFNDAVSLNYFYNISKKIGVGGIFVFEKSNRNILDSFSEKKGSMSDTYYTFMPAVKFNWKRSNIVGVYSKLAAGVSFDAYKCDYNDPQITNDKSTNLYFAFQCSLIGVEIGKKISGFAELGFGNEGIFNIGIRAKL